MIRFKSTLSILGLLFSFAATAQDNGKGCALDVSRSKLKVSSCTQTSGVTIWKLFPPNKPVYAGNLDALPTFILAGDDFNVVLKLMDGDSLPYVNLIDLPSHGRIHRSIDASAAVKARMNKENWRLTNVIDVTYEGAGDNEGPYVICSTYDRKGISGYIVVSQCNDFQEESIAALKDLLDLVEVQLR
ncbi:hypothetical protein ACCD10_29470 [Pseudomonas sp. Pseusp122]|uniref:hypothetical protein n=1 Tax=unclassified Pseudomonas TaxID=196821 RepID=UPI0039A74143